MGTKMPHILCKRIIMLTLLGCMVQSLQAATLTVTNASNSGSGSLRAILANANDGDNVVFARSLKNSTIMLVGSGQLNIDKNITLNGDVDADKKPDITINGGGRVRLFKIGSGTEVALKSLNLIRGNVGGLKDGGGILNSGALTMAYCQMSNNYVDAGEYQFARGGAILNEGTLSISESTFNGNNSGGGGAIRNIGTLTISESSFTDNNSGAGGAINNEKGGTLTISKSSFNDNNGIFSGSSGGAIWNRGTLSISESSFNDNESYFGGAIDTSRGKVYIRQSTFKNNVARVNGGVINGTLGKVLISASTLVYNRADLGSAVFTSVEGTTVIRSSTLYGNKSTADHGGTVQAYGYEDEGGSTVSLSNTIIAGSTGSNCGGQGKFTFTTDHSWFDDDSCPNGDASGTDSGDPDLEELRDNGGYTETMMPSGKSGLINAGDSQTCTALDQRLAPRVGTCDIGSVEYGSSVSCARGKTK